MKPVWIIDDDRSIRWVFEKALTREDIAFKTFRPPQEALRRARQRDAASGGQRHPHAGRSGPRAVAAGRSSAIPHMPVIIMTAYSDLESAVAAFQGGAFEYLPKPFDVDQAVELIRRAHGREHAPGRGRRAAERRTPEILGQAPAMQEVFRAIGRLSQSHATVLITGESGTGKELVARALHRHSPRAAKPFIAINTAAIPQGPARVGTLRPRARRVHRRADACAAGASSRPKAARCSSTRSATCRSDLQTRLLRVLSDGQFYRVGGHQPIKANVRVIAATHQNLEARVKQGLFREDLFHRLNVIRLRLPPLRERREDIPLLAQAFPRARARSELGVEAKRLSDAALQILARAGLSRQRAPAREPVPLAHRDGAGRQRRRQ